MSYVDGFVLPVPTRKLAAYRRLARTAGKVWREHGALEYVECLADDVNPGKLTSFPQSVKLKRGETVVFAWVVYRSRRHRDRVNARVMQDPAHQGDGDHAPRLRRQAHVLGRVQGDAQPLAHLPCHCEKHRQRSHRPRTWPDGVALRVTEGLNAGAV